MKDYKIVVKSITHSDGKVEVFKDKAFVSLDKNEASEHHARYHSARDKAMRDFLNFLTNYKAPFKVSWDEYRRNTYAQNNDWKWVSGFESEVKL